MRGFSLVSGRLLHFHVVQNKGQSHFGVALKFINCYSQKEAKCNLTKILAPACLGRFLVKKSQMQL